MNSYVSIPFRHDNLPTGYVTSPRGRVADVNGYVSRVSHESTAGQYVTAPVDRARSQKIRESV
ncbi:MAG: hypothetical protein JWL94_1465 [Microbacteriaceae bacterium]|jgi:hypothetical protein|nr:hypothetical protein [Microbacteriaceae bacterium]